MHAQKHKFLPAVCKSRIPEYLTRMLVPVLLLIFLVGSEYIQAQEDTTDVPIDINRIKSEVFDYSQIKSNPLTVLWGAIPLTSEYRLTWESSTRFNQYYNIGVAWLGKNIILFEGMTALLSNSSHMHFQGFHVHLNYRWIIDGSYMPEGFYVGPHLSWAKLRIEHDASAGLNDHAIIEHIHAAFLIGYQAELLDVFYVDFFGGVGYKENNWWNSMSSSSQKLIDFSELNWIYDNHFKLKAGFSVGVKIR